jgi:hypothetical protein
MRYFYYTENRSLRPDKKLHTPVGVPPSGLLTSLRSLVRCLLPEEGTEEGLGRGERVFHRLMVVLFTLYTKSGLDRIAISLYKRDENLIQKSISSNWTGINMEFKFLYPYSTPQDQWLRWDG